MAKRNHTLKEESTKTPSLTHQPISFSLTVYCNKNILISSKSKSFYILYVHLN